MPNVAESYSGLRLAWQIIQFLFFFGVILVLVYLTIKYLGKRLVYTSSGRFVRILDVVALGTNRGLYLVQVGEKVFLMGVTDHQISKLAEIDNPEDLLRPESQLVPEEWGNFWGERFKQVFDRVLRRRGEEEKRP